jgi:hypothetical protein
MRLQFNILKKNVFDRSVILQSIPLILSAFTHLWNPIGFPDIFYDEGIYMQRSMRVLEGLGPQEPSHRYDHPYFGQIVLAGALGIVGYPDSLSPSNAGGSDDDDDVLHSVETLYLFPRVLMGLLAIADTFLIYKITEHRYHNRNVALVAAILFAVMPYGWLFRRIFLETIQVPFLLTSILLAVYIKDLKIEKKDNSNNSNNTPRYKTIAMVLLSGALLGLSIFTKVPVFTMIPLVGFLIYTNSNNPNSNNTNGHRRIRLRNLGLWFIPVILIPLIWPAHAMIIGEFDQWKHGVLWQTSERPSRPLIATINTFFKMDPVLFVLSTAGLIFAAVKRDFFLLLWVIPFLIFLYAIDYVSSFHLIPLIPAFCIAASRFLVEITSKIKIIKKYKIQQILPFAVISGIIIFGLVSTTMLITTNVNSTVYKALAVIIQKLPNRDDTNNTSPVTLVGAPNYFWLPRYAYDKDFVDKTYYSGSPLKTQKYVVVADRGYMASKSGTAISTEDINPTRPPNHSLQDLLDNSHTIAIFLPDDTAKHYAKNYPYLDIRQNPRSTAIEIKSNY